MRAIDGMSTRSARVRWCVWASVGLVVGLGVSIGALWAWLSPTSQHSIGWWFLRPVAEGWEVLFTPRAFAWPMAAGWIALCGLLALATVGCAALVMRALWARRA